MTKQEEAFARVLNPIAFEGVLKEDFKAQYKGKLPFDLNDAWNWILKNRPKTIKKESKKQE